MTHVEKILTDVVKVLRKLREQGPSPHALIWGKWGTGKTVAAQKISRRELDVVYVRFPDEGLSKSRLYRIIGFAIGCGARKNYEATIDLLRHHVLFYNLRPILIIDEAQRIIKKQHILNELKDLAEDQDLLFSYIFLGDQSIPRLVASHDHSLLRRVVIKKELQPLEQGTIEFLAKEYQIQVDPVQVFRFAQQRGWTTLDVAICLQALKNQKVEPSEEVLEKLAKALGR